MNILQLSKTVFFGVVIGESWFIAYLLARLYLSCDPNVTLDLPLFILALRAFVKSAIVAALFGVALISIASRSTGRLASRNSRIFFVILSVFLGLLFAKVSFPHHIIGECVT